MKSLRTLPISRPVSSALAALLLTFAFFTTASAQDKAVQDKSTPDAPTASQPTPGKPPDTSCFSTNSCAIKTFYLTNIAQQHDANEVVTAVRNMLDSHVHIYWVASQNAIVVEAPPDQLRLAQEILHDLDRPNKTYRLTYTVAEMDGKQDVGTQHFSMIVVAGQRTVLKQGDKIPVATGTYGPGNTSVNGVQTQFTYIDVGMNFDASLEEFANGVRLQSNVTQSSLGQPNMIAGIQEPVIRQIELDGTSFLSPGKPVILGSIDISGTTRHDDISVVMDQVP